MKFRLIWILVLAGLTGGLYWLGTRWLGQKAPENAAETAAAAPPAVAAAISSPASPSQNGSSPPPAAPGLYSRSLAKMPDDPNTQQFLRDQQRASINQLYGPLIQRLALSPEDAERFRNLLLDRARSSSPPTASAAAAPSPAGSGTNAPEPGAPAPSTLESGLRQLLGDSRYAQFQEYQLTVTERAQLNLFQQQLGFGNRALSDDQTEQLLRLIKEEKQSLMASGVALPGTSPDLSSAGAYGPNDEQTDTLVRGQESVNQRVLERARSILSAAQLEAFARFQTNQLETLRTGLSYGRSLAVPVQR